MPGLSAMSSAYPPGVPAFTYDGAAAPADRVRVRVRKPFNAPWALAVAHLSAFAYLLLPACVVAPRVAMTHRHHLRLAVRLSSPVASDRAGSIRPGRAVRGRRLAARPCR